MLRLTQKNIMGNDDHQLRCDRRHAIAAPPSPRRLPYRHVSYRQLFALQTTRATSHHPHTRTSHGGSILNLGPGADVNTAGISLWLLGLICFTIALENMLHQLVHSLGKHDSPGNQMLHKVRCHIPGYHRSSVMARGHTVT